MADCAPPSSDHQKLIDRLSNLPDHILLHILSFVPTKTAVATSVLSKPWQHLWTLVPAIDYDYDDGSSDDGLYNGESFEHLVSKAFDINKAPIIRRVRLSGKNCKTSYLDRWVSSAAERNVEELDLDFCYDDDIHYGTLNSSRIFTFLCALESCKTLVDLKVTIRGELVIGDLYFPTLRVLHIDTAGFESQDQVFNSSQFPLLEELVLGGSTRFRHDINISLPKLRILGIDCVDSDDTLNIEAPSLQYLSLSRFGSGGFRVETLHNLVAAHVDAFTTLEDEKSDEYGESLINFVNVISKVRWLSLSFLTMKALWNASFGSFFQADRIRRFHNLVELDLHLESSVLSGITMIMLSKFENLKHLKIIEHREYSSEYRPLAPPTQVPNCLTCHLKTFCFGYFEASQYGLEFTIYILENSLVLESAEIFFSDDLVWKKARHCETVLSATRRGSLECQLEFYQEANGWGRYDYP